MIVYQVISVLKCDLDIQIQLEATFKSFKNAQNFIQLKIKCWTKIDGPCHYLGDFGNFGEYIASCRIDGIMPRGFEDFYIKTCPILDGKKERGGRINMADIELVIKIPEEIYQNYKKVWQKRRGSIPESCIAFGTPLPKGHGRLLDENIIYENVDKDLNWVYDLSDIFDYIAGLPAVIPAESEDKEE